MKNDLIENQVDRDSLMDEYWSEYLHDYEFNEDYWFHYEKYNYRNKRLLSYFLNHSWFVSDEEIKIFNPIKNALSRKSKFSKDIESQSIESVKYAIFLVEKHSRAKMLNEKFLKTTNQIKFSDTDIWSVISEIWVSCEFNCSSIESADCWREIFSCRNRPDELVANLPSKIKIYRGGHRNGFSWTEDIEVAKSFQERTANFFARHIESDDANQVELLTMTVDREDILFKGTRENELVIDPDSMDCYFKFNEFEVLDVMDTKR